MLYSRIRHPLYVGWAIAFLVTPTMTVGHLLFAVSLIGYMLIAVRFEERDFVDHFGTTYREYQRRVPMFLPKLAAGKTHDGERAGALPVVSLGKCPTAEGYHIVELTGDKFEAAKAVKKRK